MIRDIRVLLENKIKEGSGKIALSPLDTADPLFKKALLAAGTGEGWYLQLSGGQLEKIAEKKEGEGFTFTAETVSMERNGKASETMPFQGFAMELIAKENKESGTERYILRFFRQKAAETGNTLKELFPNLSPSRTIAGGVMMLEPSLIGDILLEEECYYYDTDVPDLEKESEEDNYPQPLFVEGYLNLAESKLKKEYPFFPERMKLCAGEEGVCMLRFFERENPAFRFYAQTDGTPFSFSDILLRFNGFGLFLTNLASDAYATLEDSGIVSQAMLYIKAVLCTTSQSIDLILYSDLFQNAGYWNFSAQFPDGISMNQGLGFLFDILQVPSVAEELPQDVWLLSHLLLREINFSIFAQEKEAFADSLVPALQLAKIGFLVQSDAEWKTPIPLLSFDNVGISLEAIHNGDTYSWHGNLFTDFVFRGKSSEKSAVAFRTILALPDLSIRAWLLEEVRLPLSEALSGFLGTQIYGLPENLRLTDATIRGSYQDKSLSFGLIVQGDWGFSIGNNRFALTELSGGASFSPGDFSAFVGGLVELQAGTRSEAAVLALTASYQKSEKAWLFTGGLNSGRLELVTFVMNFFGTPPAWVHDYAPKIAICDFDFSYSTADGNPMAVSGMLDTQLPLSFFGTSFQMQIQAHVEREPKSDDKSALSGGVQGVIRIGQFALRAAAQFLSGEEKASYTFEFWLDKSFLQASVIRSGKKELLKISLQNMTVGDVIVFFGRLVNPNYDFKLEPPWDALEKIPLSGTELTVDLLDKALTFIYPLNKNIGIATIGNLGFRYGWGKKQKGFDIILTGDFLGKKYTQDKPLSWDAMNEAPPKESADGGKFDLSFLAFGEHVTYDGYAQKNVSAALAAMKKAMNSMDEDNPDPFSGQKVRFDAAAGLVLGLEAKIAGFISLQAVFKQPDLYGGLLTLSGNGAGSLSGLAVELLYTAQNGIGCFSVSFMAPYRFRRLSFGAVTLELGRIAVEIYTNGGFMVDLGFPHNMNFQNSFGLEVFPFKGKGGAYFGVLHGNTWNKLPSTNKGVFSPVIAFGLGLDIGVGKSFDAGILSASVSASVTGILEGVLAWFHPYHRDSSDFYYYVSGSVAVKGSLWGKVDFVVIAVTVGVNLSAGLAMTLRSAEPTPLTLWVDVEAYASIRILFVKVSFSFHIHLAVDFTFGKAQSAPWKNTLGEGMAFPGIVRKHPRQRLAAFAACQGDIRGRGLDYEAVLANYAAAAGVEADAEEQALQVWLTPYFTAKDINVHVQMNGLRCEEPSLSLCFFLTLPDEKGDRAAVRALATAFLHLNLNALGIACVGNEGAEDVVIRWDHLKYLEELLSDTESAYEQFTVDTIVRTLQASRILFQISYPKEKSKEENPVEGTAFPMPPALTGVWQKAGSSMIEKRNYADYGSVDDQYVAWLRKLYGSFYEQNVEKEGLLAESSGSSMAEHIFRGYFYMLARITVQKGLFVLETMSCPVEEDTTLRSICERYPWVDADWLYRAGDTIEDIGENFGMTGKELLFLNPSLAEKLADWTPGETYSIKLGLTPQALLNKNPEWKMKNETSVSFPLLPCVVGNQDTLYKMTERVGGSLTNTIKENLDVSGLLSEDKEFTLSGMAVDLPHSMLLDLWAVVFYVRIFQPDLPKAEWYYEAILSLNEEKLEEWEEAFGFSEKAEVQADTSAETEEPDYLVIPAEYERTEAENRIKWKIIPGDTPRLIASYCALYQEEEPEEDFLLFRAKVRQANEAGGDTRFILPADTKFSVLSGETLRELTVRLFFTEKADIGAICTAADFFAKLPILKAGQTLKIADAVLSCAGETVQEFANKWRVPFSDLAELIQEEKVWTAGKIMLPALYGLPLSQMTDQLFSGQNLKDIDGLLSRFLWNGQVVPEKFENGQYVNLMGLYEKTGQQFSVRPDDALLASDTAYTFTLQKNSSEDSWVELSGGSVEAAITNEMIWQNCPDTILSHVYLERKAQEPVEKHLPEFWMYEIEDWEKIKESTEEQTEGSEAFEILYFPEGFGLYQLKAALRKKQIEEEACNEDAAEPQGVEISGACFATAVPVLLSALSDTLYAVRLSDEAALKKLKAFVADEKEAEVHLLLEEETESGKWISQPIDKQKNLIFNLNGDYAAFGDSLNFARALWECGLSSQMVYLHLESKREMKPGEERKCLLVLALPEQEETVPSASNCAMIPGYLDKSREQVFAVEQGGYASAVNMFPIAAGTAAYHIAVEQPKEETKEENREKKEKEETEEKQLQTRRIFSLASFQIEEEPFSSLNLLLPMLPQTMGKEGKFQGKRYASQEVWRYPMQLKLAEAIEVEEGTGEENENVPPASSDPYRGIAYARKQGWSSPYQVTVKTIWHDLAGNRSEPEPALSVEFGYSDALKAPLSYEAVSGNYWIEKEKERNEAKLFAALYFDCGAFMPDGRRGLSSGELAEAAENLAQAYYQAAQEDIDLSLSCSLLPEKVSLKRESLQKFLASAWAYLKILEKGTNVSLSESQTIEEICDTYGVDYEGLAVANGNAALKTLFGSSQYSIPEMTVWKEGDTLGELCGKEEKVYACDYNVSLPLRTGVLLKTESRKVAYAAEEEAVSLSWIAGAVGIPAYHLAQANRDLKNIWKEKVTFAYNGYSVTAEEADSLSDIAKKFQEEGVVVTAEELAMEYEKADVWKPKLTLSADVLVAEEGMTLAGAAEQLGVAATALADLNLSTVNLFADGAMLLTAESSIYEQSLSFDEMSLKEAAALLGIKPQTLLYLNREKKGGSFQIPGHVDILWPEASKSSYFTIKGSSVQELVQQYDVDVMSLYYANQAVTGILEENVVLTVKKGENSYQITTKKEDTLASLPVRFAAAGCEAAPEEILAQNKEAALFISGKNMFYPVEQVWEVSLADRKYPSGCFALESSLKLERQRASMHSKAVDTEAQNVSSILPPLSVGDSYTEFAKKAKEALPQMMFCVHGTEGGSLWAVILDSEHFGGLTVAPHPLATGSDSVPMPIYYALRPLALEFLSRSQVSLLGLEQDGTLFEAEKGDYTEIDLDLWADDFLEAMDWLVKPEILERLLYVDAKLLGELYSVRSCLLQAVCRGLGICLQPLTPLADEKERLMAARKELAARLGPSLSDIVSESLVLQYDKVSKGQENQIWYLEGSVCLPEENEDSTSREAAVYGGRIQAVGKAAENYQHFFLDAGNPYRLTQFSLEGLSWQTTQLEVEEKVLKPVLSEALSEVSIELSSEVPAPLFLRRTPETPTLLYSGEEFEADYSKILSWAAEYRLHLPVRVQDTTILKLQCNAAEAGLVVHSEEKDLFDCLAAFRAVCEPLKECIKEGDDTTVRNALHSWILLAGETAECWEAWWNVREENENSRRMEEKEGEGGLCVSFYQKLVWKEKTPLLILTREGTGILQNKEGQKSCFGEIASEIGYPQIACKTGETEFMKLTLTEQEGCARYAFPEGWEADWERLESLFFEYRFPVANILHIYNVQLEAQVKRNAMLPECSKDLSALLKVNEAFIYTTPVCRQEGCSEPLARLERPLDGGVWSEGAENPLKTFFEKLEEGNVLDCVIDYSFQNGSFLTKLPVAGFFRKTVQKDTTLKEIETELANWKKDVNPSENGAKWHFCLRVYNQAENDRLMAEYREVVFPLHKNE